MIPSGPPAPPRFGPGDGGPSGPADERQLQLWRVRLIRWLNSIVGSFSSQTMAAAPLPSMNAGQIEELNGLLQTLLSRPSYGGAARIPTDLTLLTLLIGVLGGTPDTPLEIRESTGGVATIAPQAGTLFHVSAADGTNALITLDAFNGGTGGLVIRVAGGTVASPSALAANFQTYPLVMAGFGTAAYHNSAFITATASENWTDAAIGSRWDFYVVPNGTAVAVAAARFDQDGSVKFFFRTRYLAIAAPGTPVAGETAVYMDTADGALKTKDPNAVVSVIGPKLRSKAQRTTTQTTTTSVTVAISFDSNIIDVGGMHSTSTNPTRFTCIIPGLHNCSCLMAFAGNVTGIRQLAVLVNGVALPDVFTVNNPAAGSCQIQIVAIAQLAVGDYVEFAVFQSSGGNLNVNSGALGSVYLVG